MVNFFPFSNEPRAAQSLKGSGYQIPFFPFIVAVDMLFVEPFNPRPCKRGLQHLTEHAGRYVPFLGPCSGSAAVYLGTRRGAII